MFDIFHISRGETRFNALYIWYPVDRYAADIIDYWDYDINCVTCRFQYTLSLFPQPKPYVDLIMSYLAVFKYEIKVSKTKVVVLSIV